MISLSQAVKISVSVVENLTLRAQLYRLTPRG